MDKPIVHWLRPDFEHRAACRITRGHLYVFQYSRWEPEVTCKLCRRTIEFKKVFPLARHEENAMSVIPKSPHRLSFSEKALIHDLMKSHLHRAQGNDDKGRPYFKYGQGFSDKVIYEHLSHKIVGLNAEHVSSHRLSEFGVLVPTVLKPPVPGSLAALQQQFDNYKKHVDGELEVHRKAILFMARQKGIEPQVRDILDE